MKRHFFELLHAQWQQKRFLCVGLDPDLTKFPPSVNNGNLTEKVLVRFFCDIVDATAGHTATYKPNLAFFERHALKGGISALWSIIRHIHKVAPDVPVICDAKRGDIGHTNEASAELIFGELGCDAVTLNPYVGRDAMEPFLKHEEKGCIFIAKTSNPGSGKFQDIHVNTWTQLWIVIARTIQRDWNKNGNCGLVIGATYPAELARARRDLEDDAFILVPGLGTQGGDLEASVASARNSDCTGGAVFNSSRGIIYASSGLDYAMAAGEAAAKMNRQLAAAMTA